MVTVMTRDCYKDVYLPGPALWGTGHLGHILLSLSWVELFFLLCYKKVTQVCHPIEQIFHSSSKNRRNMTQSGISLHILLAVMEYLLNILHI